jgi:hypothetical protein
MTEKYVILFRVNEYTMVFTELTMAAHAVGGSDFRNVYRNAKTHIHPALISHRIRGERPGLALRWTTLILQQSLARRLSRKVNETGFHVEHG